VLHARCGQGTTGEEEGGCVRSSQDWSVAGEPEGWADGAEPLMRRERGVRRCKGHCTVRHSHPLLSPAAGHVGALTSGPCSLVTASWPGLTVASPQVTMMRRPA
jgi:hypothetical protein